MIIAAATVFFVDDVDNPNREIKKQVK